MNIWWLTFDVWFGGFFLFSGIIWQENEASRDYVHSTHSVDWCGKPQIHQWEPNEWNKGNDRFNNHILHLNVLKKSSDFFVFPYERKPLHRNIGGKQNDSSSCRVAIFTLRVSRLRKKYQKSNFTGTVFIHIQYFLRQLFWYHNVHFY